MENQEKATIKSTFASRKHRSYNEIIEFLDSHWTSNKDDKQLSCIKQLDKACDNPSKKVKTIIVGGHNGKSLTINFTANLIKGEGLTVGTFYSPHFLTYNERFAINNETISNKAFTEYANEIITIAEAEGLTPNTYELLTIIALHYFAKNNIDVALLETYDAKINDAVTICNPCITAITRVVGHTALACERVSHEIIKEVLSVVKEGTYVLSADPSKINLQIMSDIVTEKGGTWGMPIRKLAQLAYPLEQLHGRSAALSERIANIFVNQFAHKDALIVSGTILTKWKKQRGRPTIEAKKQAVLNPQKTIDQFWRDAATTLPSRFQLLNKEKPTLLLDNASNLDALRALLLGVRLLHYQRPLKGLTLILGCNNPDIDLHELFKLLRYFFKKTSGQVIICPIKPLPGHKGSEPWNVEKITNDIKSMKVKARAVASFKEAFEIAQKSVDERYGLVVITGCSSIISEYWHNKGIKKL